MGPRENLYRVSTVDDDGLTPQQRFSCRSADLHLITLVGFAGNFRLQPRNRPIYILQRPSRHVNSLRDDISVLIVQGSFWVWPQPMRDGVTLYCGLLLAQPITRMSPLYV